jgi:hypothetical protein
MKYIDVEKLKELLDAKYKEFREKGYREDATYYYFADGLDVAEQLVDSLQQEQPEVNLEKELQAFLCNYDYEFDDDPVPFDIATHFYELGKLNMRKDVISNNKSSLLSNLDEVAEEYANKEYSDEPCVGRWGTGDYEPPVDNEYPREIAKDAFKAGAEWVIKQLKKK